MRKIFLLSAILVVLFTSCSKNKYGKAEIISNTYTVSWTYAFPSYKTLISEPLITQDIIDNGAVMVYMSHGNGGGWIALPCTLPQDATYSSAYSFVIYDGGLSVWKTDTDMYTLDPGTKTFKVVILSQQGLIQHPGLDLTDYETVEKELNL